MGMYINFSFVTSIAGILAIASLGSLVVVAAFLAIRGGANNLSQWAEKNASRAYELAGKFNLVVVDEEKDTPRESRDKAKLRHLRSEQDRALGVQLAVATFAVLLGFSALDSQPVHWGVFLALFVTAMVFLACAFVADPAGKEVALEQAERRFEQSKDSTQEATCPAEKQENVCAEGMCNQEDGFSRSRDSKYG